MENSFDLVWKISANGFQKELLDGFYFINEEKARDHIDDVFGKMMYKQDDYPTINQTIITHADKTTWIQLIPIMVFK